MKKVHWRTIFASKTLALFLALQMSALTSLSYARNNKDSAQQADTYKQAAKDADKAAKTAMAIIPFYTVGLAICIAACACANSGGCFGASAGWEVACSATGLAAGIADLGATFAMTQDFTQSLIGLGSVFISGIMLIDKIGDARAASADSGTKTEEGTQAPGAEQAKEGADTAAEEEFKWGSCIQAGMMAIAIGTKSLTMKQSLDTAALNKKKSKELQNSNSLVVEGKTDFAPTSAGDGSAENPGQGNLGDAGLAASDNDSENTGPRPCTRGNLNQMLGCAAASDTGLSNAFSKPEFIDAAEKATGGLENFLHSITPDTPTGSIVGAAGAGIYQDPTQVAATYEDFEGKLAEKYAAAGMKLNGSSYSSGGGGGTKAKRERPDFAKLFSGLMDQLKPKQAEEKQTSGVNTVDLTLRRMDQMDPDDLYKTRSISLFTRISYRYLKSRGRVEFLPYSSDYNRRISGQSAYPGATRHTPRSRQSSPPQVELSDWSKIKKKDE